MKYRYTIFATDGTITPNIMAGKLTLEQLQASVGGLIELLPLLYWENDPKIMEYAKGGEATVYINEEGKLDDLPINRCFKPAHLDAHETFTNEAWDDVVVGQAIMEVEIDD